MDVEADRDEVAAVVARSLAAGQKKRSMPPSTLPPSDSVSARSW